jgi:hypothetical protein
MFGLGMSSVDRKFLQHAEATLSDLAVAGINVKEVARKIYDEVKIDAQRRYGKAMYSNGLDKVLQNTPAIEKRILDGVTMADIQNYWSRPIIVGLLDAKIAEMMNYVFMATAQQQGRDLIAAARDLRRSSPTFGDPGGWDLEAPVNAGLTQEDAYLYPELAARIMVWRQKTSRSDQDKALEGFSSFNAMVRALIRSGRM